MRLIRRKCTQKCIDKARSLKKPVIKKLEEDNA